MKDRVVQTVAPISTLTTRQALTGQIPTNICPNISFPDHESSSNTRLQTNLRLWLNNNDTIEGSSTDFYARQPKGQRTWTIIAAPDPLEL